MYRKLIGVLVAAFAMLTLASGAATAAAPQSSAATQAKVDAVLAAIPGGTQVSRTEVRYDGMNAHVNAPVSSAAAIPCDDGWFCIVVNGTRFEFYTCQTWNLSNWTGSAPFNNNQSPGTVARAYGSSGQLVWSNVAKSSGTVNVSPWWSFRPC